MNELDPKELQNIVEKAKNGDNDAFSLLYTAYFTPLYRYIYFRVSNKAEAEDLTQDVFVKAYASFSRYSYSGTSPLAYFYTIARNTIIDYRRKKRLTVADDEDGLLQVADERNNPQEQAVQVENADMVKEQIAKLPEDQQDVIVLRFIDELTTKEVAIMLKKSEESVRQLQSRALRTLRKYMNINE